MPKVDRKYTETLYVYATPTNAKFIRTQVRKSKVSLALYMDALFDHYRTRHVPLKIVKPPTVAEIRVRDRAERKALRAKEQRAG